MQRRMNAAATSKDVVPQAPRRVALASGEVARVCWLSRQHAAATRASTEQVRRASDLLRELLQRGITSVPYGVVLDWMLLIDLEWDFPFRSLAEQAPEVPTRALPFEYENECLNPYLLSPNLRRLREVMTLRGKSLPRMIHLLERIFEGVEAHVPVTLSHYHVEPTRLVHAFQDLAAEPEAQTDAQTAALHQRLAALVAELHDGVAAFLRERLAGERSAEARVEPFRPSDVDIYELEHVEIFGSRAARLHCRRLGEVAHALGPLDTRRLTRALDVPEVVVNNEDETLYPAGGVAELTTSGSFENLLSSELVYLEDPSQRDVDLFSLKYVENELLYFVRDAGLLVRRRRLIRIVVWQAHGFRVKMPQQAYPFDQYLAGLLLRLGQDLFDYFKGEGVHLALHWCFAESPHEKGASPEGRRQGRESDTGITAASTERAGPAGASVAHGEAGGVAADVNEPESEMFDLLFRAERDRRLASFHGHRTVASLAEAMSQQDSPLAHWLVILPPQPDGVSGVTSLAPLLRLKRDGLREGDRPVHLLHWAGGPLADPGVAANERLGPLALHEYPRLTYLQPRPGEAGPRLRELHYAFPADETDPISALRELRQFLINLFISVT